MMRRFLRPATLLPSLSLLTVLMIGLLSPGAAPSARGSTTQIVRIGILLGQDVVSIGADGNIEAGGNRFGPVVRLRSANGWLQAGPGRYRGAIELRRAPEGKLTAINELDVEQYLYGVLKMEVDAGWPAEALKAQAVAARTLALQSLGRFAAEGYDLRATTDSQVYGGISAEDPRTTAAVDATRDIIMTHTGRPIFAAYHSDSGGATESSEFVWGQPYPYLRGVPDPYGQDYPGREWLSRIDIPTLEARLVRAGKPVPGVAGVAVTATSPSGRAPPVRGTAGGLRPPGRKLPAQEVGLFDLVAGGLQPAAGLGIVAVVYLEGAAAQRVLITADAGQELLQVLRVLRRGHDVHRLVDGAVGANLLVLHALHRTPGRVGGGNRDVHRGRLGRRRGSRGGAGGGLYRLLCLQRLDPRLRRGDLLFARQFPFLGHPVDPPLGRCHCSRCLAAGRGLPQARERLRGFRERGDG